MITGEAGAEGFNGWVPFSVMDLPLDGFVLAFVVFDEPHVMPAMHVAYYSVHDGYWRTRHGRLRGRVTHWMPLPNAPALPIHT